MELEVDDDVEEVLLLVELEVEDDVDEVLLEELEVLDEVELEVEVLVEMELEDEELDEVLGEEPAEDVLELAEVPEEAELEDIFIGSSSTSGSSRPVVSLQADMIRVKSRE